MHELVKRPAARLRALAALTVVAGLALVGSIPGGADTESASPESVTSDGAESPDPTTVSPDEAAPETPSVDNSAGGGAAS